MDVPFAGVRTEYPEFALRVLDHKFFEGGIELRGREASRRELSFEPEKFAFGDLKFVVRHSCSTIDLRHGLYIKTDRPTAGSLP